MNKRISGRKGHLSNDQALELFLKHRPEHLQLLILSHLSQNNNRPDLVTKMFAGYAGGTKVVIASRQKETDLFNVERTHTIKLIQSAKKPKENKAQLSLFEF